MRVAVVVGLASLAALLPPAARAQSGWSLVPSPPPGTNQVVDLDGVSCAGADACMAVGDPGWAQWWDGTAWTVSPGIPGRPRDVACRTTQWCMAVGDSVPDQGSIVSMAARWDGSTWALLPTPNGDVGSGGGNFLTGVSCTSENACTAVGYYERDVQGGRGGTRAPLIVRWDGSAWTIQSTTGGLASPDGSALTDVACTSATSCTAVGAASSAVGAGPLVTRWNGSTWTPLPVLLPADGNGGALYGVSCTSAAACTAVGWYVDVLGAQHPLVERGGGGPWRSQPSPEPAGLGAPELHGVSCASATACTAVGSAPTSPGALRSQTLAQRWNGSAWVVDPTPNPDGVDFALNGVSCPSPVICRAVGSTFLGAPGTTPGLTEHYAG